MDSLLVQQALTSGAIGIAIAFVLVVLGVLVPKRVLDDKDKQIAELKAAVDKERDRGDAATQALQMSKDSIVAMQTGIMMAHQQQQHQQEESQRQAAQQQAALGGGP